MFFSSFYVCAQDQAQGLFQSFESLIDLQKNNYQKKLEKLSTKTTTLSNLSSAEEVELDPDFLNTILFYSAGQYTSLGYKDRCSFYDLYLAGHIQGPQGPIRSFIINYKTKKNEILTATITPKLFLEKVAFIQCPESKKFSQYFQLKNLKKTLKTIYLKSPSSNNECYQMHDSFLSDYRTPYLCQIYETIDSIPQLQRSLKNTTKSAFRKVQQLKSKLTVAKRYKKLLNENSYVYLKNLCDNIEKPKRFCFDFFNTSFWNKVSKGEKSTVYIEKKCLEHTNKRQLTKNVLTQCARDFTDNPLLCHYLNKYNQAISPKQNCDLQSFALNQSKLFANYQDCPSRVGNMAITNVSRVIKHIDPKSKSYKGSSCELDTTHEFVKFNHEASDGRFWGFKLCYDDKINQVEVCYPSLTGDLAQSPYSLGKVVAKILYKTRGYEESKGCELIEEKDYKPILLKYKTGCFIITQKDQCYGEKCKFKVILDELEVKHIKVKEDTSFDYFPSSFLEENFAQTKLMETYYRAKKRKILNVSFLKSVFNEHPKSIVHGIGCAEEILPTFFRKDVLHKCTPLPFIVDGLLEDDGSSSLIVRTALDDIHSPRIISWSYIFNGVKSYQELHPLELWGLYAIY